MQETQKTLVSSLGWKYPLEKEMAAHSGILVWKIPWAEEPVGLQSMGVTKSGTRLNEHTHRHAWTLGRLAKFHLIYLLVFLSSCQVSDGKQTLVISLRVNPHFEHGCGEWGLRWAPRRPKGKGTSEQGPRHPTVHLLPHGSQPLSFALLTPLECDGLFDPQLLPCPFKLDWLVLSPSSSRDSQEYVQTLKPSSKLLAMKNLDSVLKSRNITLPTKVHVVKTMVFPVVKYRCESWTIKKVEHRIIGALELWC